MPSPGIVNPLHIAQAKGVLSGLKAGGTLARLREIEPALAAFVADEQAALFQMLEQAGVPLPLVCEAAERLLRSALTSIESVRHANYSLWADTVVGVRLRESDPALADIDVLADFKSRYHQADKSA